MRRRVTTPMISRGPVLPVHEGSMNPGSVFTGAINHPVIATAGQPVGHCEITGMPGRIGHLAHRHRLEVCVRGALNLRRVNPPVNQVVLPIEGEVVVHVRIMEKVIGVMAMLEVIKRMD